MVNYLEPLAGNESAFGFDLGSNPARREAVEKARDTGELVATAGINLVQDSSGATGFLLMLPVYVGETGDLGIDDRRKQFTGVVNGVFRISGLLAGVMESRPGIHLSLIDAGASGGPGTASSILFTAGSSAVAEEGALSLERTIQVGDRRWIVAASESTMGFGDPVLGVLPELLLILGLATSAVPRSTSTPRIGRLAHPRRNCWGPKGYEETESQLGPRDRSFPQRTGRSFRRLERPT